MKRTLAALLLIALTIGQAVPQGVTPANGPSRSVQSSSIVGTNTNNSAGSGIVGEVLSSQTTNGGGSITLSTGTAADVTSVSLTAGDWTVSGTVCTTPAASTSATLRAGWISTTSATQPTLPNAGGVYYDEQTFTYVGGATECRVVGRMRVSVATTTSVYLSTKFAWSGGTGVGSFGAIFARRSR